MPPPSIDRRAEALLAQGDLLGARRLLLPEVARRPRDASLLERLARIQARLGELVSAEHYAARACNAAPRDIDLWRLLLELRVALSKWEDAEAAASRTLQLEPDSAGTWRNWLFLLQSGGAPARAAAFAQRCRARFPDDPDFAYKLALAFHSLGRASAAQDILSESLARFPTDLQLLQARALMLNSVEGADPRRCLEAHRALGAAVESSLQTLQIHTEPGAGAQPAAGRRLRVGLLSADLRRHSVAYFILPLLSAAAESDLEFLIYSTTSKEDAFSRELARLAGNERWHRLGGAPPERVAETIARDRLDVLIDLNGLSAGGSLAVMARRPAPIQATYLGYPNSTGLRSVDFRLVDAVSDPIGEADGHCVERLIRMSRCAWCYDPGTLPPPPPVEPRSRGSPITFGSFNVLAKVNDFTLRLWARVLRASPGSRLLIKSHGLDDTPTRADVIDRARGAGIDPSRLDLLGRVEPREDHLRAYSRVDIALDPFPYHGTTTTCESLLMGVPVVSLEGDQHRSRVGVSLLGAVGLSELAAKSESAYVEIATGLATDAPRLSELRSTLRARLLASPLCDAPGFARAFGVAVRAMVEGSRG